MPRGWFVYNPGTVTGGVTATGNWTYADHIFECTGTGIACAVYANYTGTPVLGLTHPSSPFSTRLISYLNAAAASTQPIPFGSAKKYVYIKAT